MLNCCSSISKEMVFLAILESRWRNKLFGFDEVENLQHGAGHLKHLLSRTAEQGRHENWILGSESKSDGELRCQKRLRPSECAVEFIIIEII